MPTPTTFDPSGIEEDEDDSESFDMDSWLAEDVPENEPDIETEIELETEEPELSVEPKQESAETDSEPPAKKEIAPKPAGMESDQNGKKDKTPSDTENPVKVNGSITTALRWHPHRLHLPAIRFASATIIRQGISVPLSVWVPLM